MHTTPVTLLSLFIYDIYLYTGIVMKVGVRILLNIYRKFSCVTNTIFKEALLNFQYPFCFLPRHDIHAWMKDPIPPSVTHLTDQLAQRNNKRWYRSSTEVKWQKNQSSSNSLGQLIWEVKTPWFCLLIIHLMSFLDFVQLWAVQDFLPRANRWQSKLLKIAEGGKKQTPRVNIILTPLVNITLSRNIVFEKIYWNK